MSFNRPDLDQSADPDWEPSGKKRSRGRPAKAPNVQNTHPQRQSKEASEISAKLEARVAKLEQECGRLVVQKARSDARAANFERRCGNFRSQRENRKKEVRRLRQRLEAKESKISDLLGWKETNKIQLQEDQKKLALQQDQTRKIKADLFKSRPAVGLPDTEYIQLYERLCSRINAWADRAVTELEDIWSLLENDQQHSVAHINVEGTDWPRASPRIWEIGLVALIHELIRSNVLADNLLLFGLPLHIVVAFRQVAEGRKGKDEKAATQWQIDGIKALASSPEVTQARQAKKAELARTILERIARFLPDLKIDSQRALAFENGVLDAALSLESIMRTSPAAYKLQWRVGERLEYPITEESPKRVLFSDMETGKKLTEKSRLVPNDEGRFIKHHLHCEPELSRKEGDSELVLRPARHELAFFNPVQQLREIDHDTIVSRRIII